MAKFKALKFTTTDGTQVHFVTRAKAKPILMAEIVEYLTENKLYLIDLDREKDWEPPNKKVFLTDLRSGLVFCSQKYGVSETVIESYVRNIAPHLNTNFYDRSKYNAKQK